MPVLVRVNVEDPLLDVAALRGEEFGWPARDAMRRISEEGQGVLLILGRQESPHALLERIRSLAGQFGPGHGSSNVLRTFGTGAQILKGLGVQRMRVLSAPKRMHGLSGFGLEVVEYIDRPQ